MEHVPNDSTMFIGTAAETAHPHLLAQAQNKRVCDMSREELAAVIADAGAKLKAELETPEMAAALDRIEADLVAQVPIDLVNAFTQADQAMAYHTQVCFDQQERYECSECRTLSDERYAARKAMDANAEAVALYDSEEQREQRRFWSREVFRPLSDRMSREDDY